MRKPAFCIFLWPLYSDIIFFIDQYRQGVSNKHCLLPFFHLSIFLSLFYMVTKQSNVTNVKCGFTINARSSQNLNLIL